MKVVFQNGEGALQVLPPLVDVIPEARLNLVIYYLKEGIFLNKIILKFTVYFSIQMILIMLMI